MDRNFLVAAVTVASLLAFAACSTGIGIPEGKLMDIARLTLAVGHPTVGEPTGARLVGGSPGGCSSNERYVDVEIGYRGTISEKQYYMTVRYEVVSLKPCEVATEVVSDTGPIPPLLLDNAISSTEVGRWICQELQ